MLAYSRTKERRAELVAICSPYLRYLGRDEWSEPAAEFLGVDVISVGEWSLLRAMERAAISLPKEVAQLNRSGLLRDESAIARVEAYYRELSDQGRVEPIAARDTGVPVESARVHLVDAL